ncbi:MAG: protein phosphatase 2C domain-containing protein [Ilumatobacteraceae bacterium]
MTEEAAEIAVLEACPSCGEAINAGDAFCESCGATLDPAAAIAVAQPAPVPALVSNETGDATVCLSCGGTEFADGFCSTCGTKRPVWRDHFTESPIDWVAGVCDKGVGRNANEDAMAMAVVGERAVLVVCDGVTTAPQSEKASLVAARAARDLLAGAVDAPEGDAAAIANWAALLVESCAVAQREAVAVARTLGNPPEPPSCTFVAAVEDGGLLHVAWCGDSRAYWLGDGGPSVQLTLDHSLGTEMIRAGKTREEAEAEPTCHTITRWLGADSIDPTPETGSLELAGPGWLLVCSDGLWNHLSEATELDEFVRATGSSDPMVIADALVDRANAGGGHDNITAVLARIGRDTA